MHTSFDDTVRSKGVPDLDALVAKGKQLINAGMKSVVYCGSMGDWPLLTDEQRQEGVSALIDSGIPVIVGTGAQNPFKSFSSFKTCFRKWCCRFNDYTQGIISWKFSNCTKIPF
ncbi:MAG: hypothetical protein CM1200mP30_00620 [Pseudomonadota bacterium]|nr:MAG: hypothetical protein CM1200mP30_00620 [Pseudomonadota bacterium]